MCKLLLDNLWINLTKIIFIKSFRKLLSSLIMNFGQERFNSLTFLIMDKVHDKEAIFPSLISLTNRRPDNILIDQSEARKQTIPSRNAAHAQWLLHRSESLVSRLLIGQSQWWSALIGWSWPCAAAPAALTGPVICPATTGCCLFLNLAVSSPSVARVHPLQQSNSFSCRE